MSFYIEMLQTPDISVKTQSIHETQYCVLNYNKKRLQHAKSSLYRSVVFTKENQDWRLVSFTTPQSIPFINFVEKYPIKKNHIVATEIIDGTMIQLFYDPVRSVWEIATKTTVGGYNICKKHKRSFRSLFAHVFNGYIDNEIIDPHFVSESENINEIGFLHNLPREYCYQFVLTDGLKLFLVAVYKICENNIIESVCAYEYQSWRCFLDCTEVCQPAFIYKNDYDSIVNDWGSVHSPSFCKGVMLTHTVSGERTKILNPLFFEKQKLPFLHPCFVFHCLAFLRIGKESDFLLCFPQYVDEYNQFYSFYSTFVKSLHRAYVDFFVLKKIDQLSYRFSDHIVWLHYRVYLATKLKITAAVVKEYVLSIEPHILLECLFQFD